MYRRTRVGCLKDIENLVNSSAVVNHTQLVGQVDGAVMFLNMTGQTSSTHTLNVRHLKV